MSPRQQTPKKIYVNGRHLADLRLAVGVMGAEIRFKVGDPLPCNTARWAARTSVRGQRQSVGKCPSNRGTAVMPPRRSCWVPPSGSLGASAFSLD